MGSSGIHSARSSVHLDASLEPHRIEKHNDKHAAHRRRFRHSFSRPLEMGRADHLWRLRNQFERPALVLRGGSILGHISVPYSWQSLPTSLDASKLRKLPLASFFSVSQARGLPKQLYCFASGCFQCHFQAYHIPSITTT